MLLSLRSNPQTGSPYIQKSDGLCMSSMERSGSEWAGVEWNYSGIERFDNKIRTTLALARALCLDLLLRMWLRISGGLNCCQEFWRGVV